MTRREARTFDIKPWSEVPLLLSGNLLPSGKIYRSTEQSKEWERIFSLDSWRRTLEFCPWLHLSHWNFSLQMLIRNIGEVVSTLWGSSENVCKISPYKLMPKLCNGPSNWKSELTLYSRVASIRILSQQGDTFAIRRCLWFINMLCITVD